MTTTISGSNGIVFPDDTSMQTGQQAVKAWVNFNGVGTVAIRASYNVASITDNGTGNYTVNFTTAMVDANYAAVVSGSNSSNTNYDARFNAGVAPSTTGFRIFGSTFGTPNGGVDSDHLMASVFK